MTLSPASRRRQQQLARWVRHWPGYRAVTATVLPRLRDSAMLTDLVWRVFAPRRGAGQGLLPLHAGRHLRGTGVDRLPIVGVLATGLSAEEADRLIEQVASLQREVASFRPLFILDQPAFAATRDHGYVLEHLVPESAFATGDYGDVQGWDHYLGTRLNELIHHYQFWHLARGGPLGLDVVDEQIMRTLAGRLPADLDVTPGPPEPR